MTFSSSTGAPAPAVHGWGHDLIQGLALIGRHELYEASWHEASHVRVILNEVAHYGLRQPDREVRDLWVAEDAQEVPIGMALVTRETWDPKAPPVDVVNLFVRPDARGQGLGSELLRQAMARYPHLEGHHTPSSSRLYEKHGVPDVTWRFDSSSSTSLGQEALPPWETGRSHRLQARDRHRHRGR